MTMTSLHVFDETIQMIISLGGEIPDVKSNLPESIKSLWH